METSTIEIDLLQDCIERIEEVRRSVMKFVEPFPPRELNDKPCGKGGSTRQHLNHLYELRMLPVRSIDAACPTNLDSRWK